MTICWCGRSSFLTTDDWRRRFHTGFGIVIYSRAAASCISKTLPTATKNIHNIYDDDVMHCIHKTQKYKIQSAFRRHILIYVHTRLLCVQLYLSFCDVNDISLLPFGWLLSDCIRHIFVSNIIWISHWIACRLFDLIALTTVCND